ncbi:MAG TPA: MFS transporter, partial [Ktedonobacter sp.]|nr:MFS transporter [Ktedonobacter sp.]
AIITLFIASVFVFANMYTTQAILPSLSSDFHVSAPTAGLTISLLVLSVAIGSLLYGPLSDVVGRKPVMVAASFLVAIPTLLCGLAPNFTVLVIMRAIQGFLMPGLTSVAIPYVNEEFQGKSRGLAMGIYSSGLVLGGLFARVGSAAINGVYGWRIAMLTYVVPTLLAALFMWLFLPEKYSKRRPSQHNSFSYTMAIRYIRQTLRDMWLHLHNRRLVGVYIIGFTSFFGFVGIFTYLPFYLTGPVFRLPDIALSLVYLLWLTGAGSPIAGSLAARFGSRLILAVASSCAILGLFITLVPILPIMLAGLSLLTLGMFSIQPSANLYLGDLSTTAKGTAASMYLSLYYFGGSLGGVLPGVTYISAGWIGVVAMCVGMMGIALVADVTLCR